MKRIRKSLTVKFLCIFLAINFLYISCSPDTIVTSNGCTTLLFDLSSLGNIPNNFETMLELARTLDYQEGFTTYAEYYEAIYGESEDTDGIVAAIESESAKYTDLGFDQYVLDNEDMSTALANYLIAYAGELTTYLNNQQPDLDEFKSFIASEKSEVAQSNLCEGDQEFMQGYLDMSQGYAQFYYKHYFTESELSDGSVDRDCNFWGALGCGLLAIAAGFGVAFVVTALLIALNVQIIVDGQAPQTPQQQEGAAYLAGIALGLYVGINVYNWCCGKDEIPTQTCLAPTAAVVTPVDCNDFTYRVFGPSNYGNTIWNNDNTNPAMDTTDVPTLRFAVPAYGDTSTMLASIACVANGQTVTIYDWREDRIFDSGEPPVQLTWVIAPPGSVSQGSTHSISVSTQGASNSNHLQLEWSVSDPGVNTISAGPTNGAVVTYNASSGALVSAMLTNTCTGESTYISTFTTIN